MTAQPITHCQPQIHSKGHQAYAVTADGHMLVYRPSMAGEILADFPA